MADVNEFVKELLESSDLEIKKKGTLIVITRGKDDLGSGETVAKAAMSALRNPASRQYAQALWFAGALSYGPENLFEAIEQLWGDDDESGEEDSPEDDEVDVDGAIRFERD